MKRLGIAKDELLALETSIEQGLAKPHHVKPVIDQLVLLICDLANLENEQ